MTRFTSAALNWLELILFERFGHRFILSQDESSLTLNLGSQQTGFIRFPALFNGFHLPKSEMPCAYWDAAGEGWIAPLYKPLPAPGCEALPELLITRNIGHYCVFYDILGLAYWMLSRLEEIGRKDLDSHGRFPAASSHAHKHGYLDRPVVDEWLNILGQVILRQWPDLELKSHVFMQKVSHDVDVPSMYGFKKLNAIIRVMAGHILKRHDFREFCNAGKIWLSTNQHIPRADPMNTFDWIMDTSERRGLVSAFYFICGRTNQQLDAEYDIEHPAIRHLLRRIYDRGHEIGLHPSYNTYDRPSLIRGEFERLIRACEGIGVKQKHWGGRMHYLRWENPTTLQAWEDGGLSYDSTLGYADHAGFRCGTCFEYPAFNLEKQQILMLRVRPLIVMEVSVLDPIYMGIEQEEMAFEMFRQLKDTCRVMKGSFTLLWHNSSLKDVKSRDMYIRVLDA
ncbi:MAG: polysaccharide deacetylase family protein [Burkholderiaceae bacterium]